MGWSKENQEKYPESWAKVKAVLTKQKSMLGKKQSDYQKKMAREANIGNKHCLGRVRPEVERKKISISSIGKPGTNNGKKFSKETVQKMKDSQKKAHWKYNKSEEEVLGIRRKISIARNKQILPLQNTSIEIAVYKELERRNIKFEKHKKIIGLPDAFIEPNICIFCDGDYWHANPIKYLSEIEIRFGEKILTSEQIREKDKKVTESLTNLGYIVFRFWETEIKNNVKGCIDKILLDKIKTESDNKIK